MPDPRISEDAILLISRLVNEAEDMKDAANQSLKDTWGEHRDALKALGLTGAEIAVEVAQFKAAIAAGRMSETDKQKAMTKAEGVEGYLVVLDSPRARARERQAA
jgi:hypothetical protein